MVFGIGFSVAPIGEQPDNFEAIRRAAAYQDRHRHLVTAVLDRLAGETRRARRKPMTRSCPDDDPDRRSIWIGTGRHHPPCTHGRTRPACRAFVRHRLRDQRLLPNVAFGN
jgi:hypothetical protein